jgi:hypothetical protein
MLIETGKGAPDDHIPRSPRWRHALGDCEDRRFWSPGESLPIRVGAGRERGQARWFVQYDGRPLCPPRASVHFAYNPGGMREKEARLCRIGAWRWREEPTNIRGPRPRSTPPGL